MNLDEYFQVEGFAYRLVPIKSVSSPQTLQYGRVATDIMYDNMMNKFEYGNMNDPDIYIDENNARMMTNIRNSFNRLARALVEEGKLDSAITVIDRCIELVPNEAIQYEYFSLDLAETYMAAGASDKAMAIVETEYDIYNDELGYFLSLDAELRNTEDVNQEIQKALFYFQRMERMAQLNGDEELAQKINETFQLHYQKYIAS